VALVSALAVGVGGAIGAVARYAVSLAIERQHLDTVAINVSGSFLIGVVLGSNLGGPAALALSVGFCGAFTTFSSFAVETARLAEDGHLADAARYAIGTLLAALVAVLAGFAVGRAL
jgi:CrcB protein